MKHRSDGLQDPVHLAAGVADGQHAGVQQQVQLSGLSGSDPCWLQLLALLAERKEDATVDAELLHAGAAAEQLLSWVWWWVRLGCRASRHC